MKRILLSLGLSKMKKIDNATRNKINIITRAEVITGPCINTKDDALRKLGIDTLSTTNTGASVKVRLRKCYSN